MSGLRVLCTQTVTLQTFKAIWRNRIGFSNTHVSKSEETHAPSLLPFFFFNIFSLLILTKKTCGSYS